MLPHRRKEWKTLVKPMILHRHKRIRETNATHGMGGIIIGAGGGVGVVLVLVVVYFCIKRRRAKAKLCCEARVAV